MGLSAFNRAREKRARELKQAARAEEARQAEEQARLEEQQRADEAAASAVRDLIPGLDPESPDFVRGVIAARAAYNALTPAQRALVDTGGLEAAEAVLPQKLEEISNGLQPDDGRPENTEDAGGAAQDGATDPAATGAGDNDHTPKRRGGGSK
jgi:hypothetical protein